MIDELLKNFLNDWPNAKVVLDKEMKSNIKLNADYRKRHNLTTESPEYKKNKKSLQVSKNETAGLVLDKIPRELFSRASLLDNEYQIEGSVGKGQISEIPWICVFDKEITESAQTGFYIVYLFRADLSGFYISLNQGWTQYENAFKPKSLAQIEIKKAATKLKKILRTVSGFTFDNIDLKGESDLAKGYELGNICSKYYSIDDIPKSNSLINDLQKLIGTYRELKSLVGKEILEIEYVLDEEEFQERAQKGNIRVLKEGKLPKKKKVHGSATSTWLRDPDMGFTAISNAHFKCENDPIHETFKSSTTLQQFVEAHHLIPMEFQDDFQGSIDVPENIISLCPNCHRAFHNSINITKVELIKKFYNFRKKLLFDRGIIIDENKLMEYYKISPDQQLLAGVHPPDLSASRL
jgi:5-methylcytosine-specific restriction enzyme A